MKFKAVLFDLDGTLLDTIEDLTESMNAALERMGLALLTIEQCKIFVGDGVDIFARKAIGDGATNTDIARCVELMRADYARRWTRKTRPYDGIVEMLAGVHGRGLVMGVLSNKPDDFTKEMVAHFFAGHDFKVVQGDSANFPPKPNPASAMQLAGEFGIDCSDFLFMGDSNIDMRTASAAGMYPVGALWGFRDANELTATGAKTLLAHPTELLDLL